ncbi:MAG: hypothetical protein A3D87_00735 [Omnitrophica WOR_2 bacterium RIFCSPHIGHO2_02_FULL_50_17]|nr:MAG: hypothetical protein A3D87_00735 [Omnitrophica WOR_2 bacterium RIFCSPHIGHO2_02_FULL_50_17]
MKDIKLKTGCLSSIFIVFSFLLVTSTCVYAEGEKNSAYAKDRFIVKFKGLEECPDCLMEKGAKLQDAKSKKFASVHTLNKKHGVKKMKSVFFEEDGLDVAEAKKEQKESEEKTKTFFSKRTQRGSGESLPDLSSIFMLEVAEGADIEKIVEEYRVNPNVEYAQPDYALQADFTPNDPLLTSLWGLKTIQAESAWDIAQGEGITVAVVDTGVDYTHQDLAANIWSNPAEVLNGVDDDGNGYADDLRGWNFNGANNDTIDRHGHGTHVAGTIAAVGNNGMGIVGVAPKAKIMPVKGLGDTGAGYTSHLASAIRYAASNGADVINNSWGCSSPCPSNSIAEDAVRFAHGLGAVVVFAAGNSNQDAAYYSPGNMKETVTVAASSSSETRASFSNYGAILDVSAPGVSVLSTTPGNTYKYFSGTSMAAPHVSGLAALILSSHPIFSNEDVRQAIRASADEFDMPGFDINSGHGRINASMAVGVHSVLTAMVNAPANNDFINLDQPFFSIKGTAGGSGFQDYTLDYKLAGSLEPWILGHGPIAQSGTNSLLGDMTTSGLTEGMYLVRVNSSLLNGLEFDDVIQLRAMHENPLIQRITNKAGYQGYADISGEWAGWADFSAIPALYIYDLKTGVEKLVDSYAYVFDIADNKIVYHQYLLDCLMLYHLDIGQSERLPINSPSIYSLHMAGDRIVWQGYLSGDSNLAIFFYDITTGDLRKIPLDPGYNSDPRIIGDLIVWHNRYYLDANNNTRNILQYNILTGEKTVFLPNTYAIPEVVNNRIVWQDGTYNSLTGGFDFVVYDATTAVQQKMPGLTSPAYVNYFAVSGNKIVWIEPTLTNGSQVIEYNLTTGQKQQITVFPTARRNINAGGDEIVWEEYRNEDNKDYDIYLYNPPNEAPVLEPIGSKIVRKDELLEFTVKARDANGSNLNLVHPSLDELPTGSVFNVTSSNAGYLEMRFAFTPTADQVGDHHLLFEVSDGESTASELVTITVTAEVPPEFDPMNLSYKINTGSALVFTVNAHDLNGDQLSLAALDSLPKLATFNVATTQILSDGASKISGVFNWTPNSRQAGIYSIRFQATDSKGGSVVSAPVAIEVVKPTTSGGKRK